MCGAKMFKRTQHLSPRQSIQKPGNMRDDILAYTGGTRSKDERVLTRGCSHRAFSVALCGIAASRTLLREGCLSPYALLIS